MIYTSKHLNIWHLYKNNYNPDVLSLNKNKMKKLQNSLNERLLQAGYDEQFLSQWEIGYNSDAGNSLHTVNYFNQQIGGEIYLQLNDLCVQFNEQFQEDKSSIPSEEQKEWLRTNGFEEVIDHLFSNEQLEMNFYPKIMGYYIKDKQGVHYVLVSFQKYESEDYTGLKLIQFTNPGFSFPHQNNYFK